MEANDGSTEQGDKCVRNFQVNLCSELTDSTVDLSAIMFVRYILYPVP